jgi:DNA invertase Pin-like site-specific DNA recombinase
MTGSLSAWGYVRLSQRGRDGSIEEQLATVREYARQANGIDLVTTLNEGEQTSGFNSDREKYSQLLNNIEAGNTEAVVVRDRARLSRDFDERLRLLTLFRAAQVELHVVEAGGQVNVQDVQTAAMECVHAAMDHIKKMAEIRRSRAALEEKQEQGHDLGRPPFGFRYDDASEYWVPDHDSEGDEKSDFERALDVVEKRENGHSWRDIAAETGVHKDTARNIWERRERYLTEANSV